MYPWYVHRCYKIVTQVFSCRFIPGKLARYKFYYHINIFITQILQYGNDSAPKIRRVSDEVGHTRLTVFVN